MCLFERERLKGKKVPRCVCVCKRDIKKYVDVCVYAREIQRKEIKVCRCVFMYVREIEKKYVA